MQKDIIEKKVTPGQYFVLKFDLSQINPYLDLKKADEALIDILNSSFEDFYETYAAYLGRSYADLCQTINHKQPIMSLRNCARLVRNAIKRLKGIEGIYVLVDEYDALPNNYLKPPKTVSEPNIAWEDTQLGRTFKSFWATMKALGIEGSIRKTFITGISPLSLSALGSAFNVARNLSFSKELAGLCGLTYSDLEDALNQIFKDGLDHSDYLSEANKFFNGFHFCREEMVGTVYNTETCLAYLQCRFERKTPQIVDPANSEVSEEFLQMFAASAIAVRDFETAIKRDEEGNFIPLEYRDFKEDFTLKALVC